MLLCRSPPPPPPPHCAMQRSSSDSLARRNSASASVQEDGVAHPSPQSGRRITAANIFPSSQSLEASSHHSLSLSSLTSSSDLGHLTSLEHQCLHGREGTPNITRDLLKFVTAARALEDALTLKRESMIGRSGCQCTVCVCVCVYLCVSVCVCVCLRV